MEKPDREAILKELSDAVAGQYAAKEAEISQAGADMREVERVVLLKAVDEHWMEHIDAMDQLKQGIGLRAYGQKDPVLEYRTEGFDMFDEMVQNIRRQTVRMLYLVGVKSAPKEREQLANPIKTPGDAVSAPARAARQAGRNDPCPCGSGKKYKNCCGRQQ